MPSAITFSAGGGAGAPTDAKYIVQEANTSLSAEQSLGALATGIVKNTTTAGVGVLSIGTAGTDFEGGLGNPAGNGYVLQSTTAGVRSWVAPAAATTAWPIGSVFLSVVATNPATLLGFGTWTQIAGGKFLVGQTGGDADFDVAEDTGGAKTKNLSHVHHIDKWTNNEATHTHGNGTLVNAAEAAHTHAIGTLSVNSEAAHRHEFSTGLSTGSAGAHVHSVNPPSTTSGGPSAYQDLGYAAGTVNVATYNHTHDTNISAFNSASDGAHTHAFAGDTKAISHTHGLSGAPGAGSSHNHSISGATAAGAAHGHRLHEDSESAGNASQDILPPWFTVYIFKRIS
jgi:hypothetical protein